MSHDIVSLQYCVVDWNLIKTHHLDFFFEIFHINILQDFNKDLNKGSNKDLNRDSNKRGPLLANKVLGLDNKDQDPILVHKVQVLEVQDLISDSKDSNKGLNFLSNMPKIIDMVTEFTLNCRIFANSFRGSYAFLNL